MFCIFFNSFFLKINVILTGNVQSDEKYLNTKSQSVLLFEI